MTAALEGGEWSAARPGRTLPPGKTRYPFYRRLGGPQGRSGRAENLVPTGIRFRTVQPIVSRYTDWATRHTQTHTHTHTHLYIYIYIYIYTHTHTHIYIYVCVCVCVCKTTFNYSCDRSPLFSFVCVSQLDIILTDFTKLINCKRPSNEHKFPGFFSKQSELPEEITQLLHQPLHIYEVYKIYTLKH